MAEPRLESTSPMNSASSPATGDMDMDTHRKNDWAARQDHLCQDSTEGMEQFRGNHPLIRSKDKQTFI